MQALATTNGNVTAAAKKLGISRRTLHRKINEMKVARTPAEATVASTRGRSQKHEPECAALAGPYFGKRDRLLGSTII
jgi:molybdenum-dependent DNA-binding transcriptional regulator ModE